MKIQVIGSGCPTCKQLCEDTEKVVKELEIDAEVEYISDVTKLIEIGEMTGPVLTVDGKTVLVGGGKSEEEIKNALVNGPTEGGHACSACSCGGKC